MTGRYIGASCRYDRNTAWSIYAKNMQKYKPAMSKHQIVSGSCGNASRKIGSVLA